MTSTVTVTIVDVTDISETTNMTLQETKEKHCQHGDLTTLYGIIIQFVLAFFAFSFLILKRRKEPAGERRPWLIWVFDTSKQALGAMFIHFANVFLSSYVINSNDSDPCSWYIVYFLLDSTVGLLCIYIAVRVSSFFIALFNCNTLRFGEYGYPPRWDAWAGQCAIYLLITIVEKAVVTGLASLNVIMNVAKVLMRPITNVYLEVALVMLIILLLLILHSPVTSIDKPLFSHKAVMFWVVDKLPDDEKEEEETKPGHQTPVHYHANKQDKLDGLNQSELEILLAMDEDEIKLRNGNHFAERI
ncbi:putative transmembrane protein [Apostichopus japonicus]|uniref:Putative transmembrane protein n=1 Tax=Stichopus japonicus TaxID=307972 RepID=A0A2G8L3R5_STIJA|nr:putative transmembrane protein [Apostichopus japonicus]